MRYVVLCLILFVSGCSSWRREEPLCPPVNALARAQQEAYQDPLFCPQEISANWWDLFQDEQLNCFIQTAYARNPTLAQARDNIYMAMARADQVRSTLFPNVWWGADVSRQKLSKTGVIPFPGTGVSIPSANIGSVIPEYFTLYETQLNLTYEFDIWGKNRNTLRAALSDMQAQVADAVFSRLNLGVSLALVYFQLQTDYKRQDIWRSYVKNRESYVGLVNMRVQNALDTELTLNSAKNALHSARQTLLAIEGEIAVNEYQLKTYLAGSFEEEIASIRILEQPLPCVPLPESLPLSLVARRPDIAAQLWVIQSAGKQIDVAKASFYPDFNIMAFFGFQTIHFKDLFRWESTYFNVDPAMTLPIFDAGRRLANMHISEVNYDLAISKYNELVLAAANETLAALAVLSNTHAQLEEYHTESSLLKKNVELSWQRVENNLESSLTYLDREILALSALDQEVMTRGATFQAIVKLIKALGGGYAPLPTSCQ